MVLEYNAGEVVMASLARLTCEMYLLMNRDGEKGTAAGKPQERYAQLLALYKAAEQELLARGLDDAHARLPAPVAKRFGRRLASLGGLRDDAWTPYCFRLRANQKKQSAVDSGPSSRTNVLCRARPNWNASQIHCPVVRFHIETFHQLPK
jgi:hypothetical protein